MEERTDSCFYNKRLILAQGLISPRAFTELIRITRPGGVIAWNIALGYEAYGSDYERYEEIVMGLVRDRAWEFLRPVKVSNAGHHHWASVSRVSET